jgi:hypothetical protein
MSKPTIKQLITKDNECYFDHLRQGYAYYTVGHSDGRRYNEYIFPIPLDDIGTATLNRQEKSITLMRWIRKGLENGELVFKRQMDELAYE